MIAVVYSGSNYADWRLADKGETVVSFKTSGINPYFSDEKNILQILNKNINLIHHAEEIKRIYFFGTGASSDELKTIIKKPRRAGIGYMIIDITEVDKDLNINEAFAGTVSELNAIHMAILYRSYECLTCLVEKYDLRPAFCN